MKNINIAKEIYKQDKNPYQHKQQYHYSQCYYYTARPIWT